MRNLFYVLLCFGCIISFYACEKEYTNPGDFNIKADLKLTGIVTRSGKLLPLNVLRSIDTTYMRPSVKNDTARDANGEYMKDEFGKYIISKITTFYKSDITGKYLEIEPILFDARADTIDIMMESNSKWIASAPVKGTQAAWYFQILSTGGGNGKATSRTVKNGSATRRLESVVQYILTPDSAVLYKLVFNQKGINE